MDTQTIEISRKSLDWLQWAANQLIEQQARLKYEEMDAPELHEAIAEARMELFGEVEQVEETEAHV